LICHLLLLSVNIACRAGTPSTSRIFGIDDWELINSAEVYHAGIKLTEATFSDRFENMS
jgi:hypothetical protein